MPTPPAPIYSKKTVRLPEDLWVKAQAEADLNGRSLNAEITARLIEAYGHPTVSDLARQQEETRKLVQQVLRELEAMSLGRK